MITLRAELHTHTVLSPCAELEMLPPLIVMEALQRGIKLLAITDHNASSNIEAVQNAAKGSGLTVLPGMELQTREEVHVLCLFDTLDQTRAFQKIVDASLPNLENNPDFFGDQLIVDENGDFLARETRLLVTSTSLSINEAWEQVSALQGLMIPAHVDRPANGLLPLLGFVPPETPFKALEISVNVKPADAASRFPQTQGFTLVQGGDAHWLESIAGVNQFIIQSPTISEIQFALEGHNGRSVRILSTRLSESDQQ